jgi:hypothetical protein
LAHWFRAEVETPLRVTFDSNAYRQVVNPCSARDASSDDLRKISGALKAGRVRGYLSETILTLEGIENKDRVQVLGGTRVVSRTQATGKYNMTLTVGMRQERQPLNPGFSNWVQAAQDIGMRLLQAGSRWFDGAGHARTAAGTFFEPDKSVLELAARMDRVNKVAEAIQARGLGYATAVHLGLQFSARDGASGELWLQGLGRAGNDAERKKVQNAIKEWADGDSIAAHVGYEIDLFCTKDKGRSAGGNSILNAANRTWLEQTYGVTFVTLSELAALV